MKDPMYFRGRALRQEVEDKALKTYFLSKGESTPSGTDLAIAKAKLRDPMETLAQVDGQARVNIKPNQGVLAGSRVGKRAKTALQQARENALAQITAATTVRAKAAAANPEPNEGDIRGHSTDGREDTCDAAGNRDAEQDEQQSQVVGDEVGADTLSVELEGLDGKPTIVDQEEHMLLIEGRLTDHEINGNSPASDAAGRKVDEPYVSASEHVGEPDIESIKQVVAPTKKLKRRIIPPSYPWTDATSDSNSLYEISWIKSSTPYIAAICGWRWEHQSWKDVVDVPLTFVNSLGQGSLGVVEEVRVSGSTHRSFVRKKVHIPYAARHKRLQILDQEVQALKALYHRHIVRVIGSYQEGIAGRQFYSILMYPVGEHDLRAFLDIVGDRTSESKVDHFPEQAWLIRWLGCLSSALDYMHKEGYRHQDIKPSNIIYRGRDVFFTDFSSAEKFELGHTTSTESPARTSAMYGAPETIRSFDKEVTFQKHGRAADVFSLGCVFAEMLTVVKGHTVTEMHHHILGVSDASEAEEKLAHRPLLYSEALPRIVDWFNLERPDCYARTIFHKHVKPMLESSSSNRPTAEVVLKRLCMRLLRGDQRCPCRENLIATIDARFESIADMTVNADGDVYSSRGRRTAYVAVGEVPELVGLSCRASGEIVDADGDVVGLCELYQGDW